MDLLYFLVHFVSHYFCAFLLIITGIDCVLATFGCFLLVVLLLCFLLL
nr:6b protein [Infectious bronchitis virus]